MAEREGEDENVVEAMDTDCCIGTKKQVEGCCASENQGDLPPFIFPVHHQQPAERSYCYSSPEEHPTGVRRKRGRESEEVVAEGGGGGGERVVEKRGCEEGMSWWTCLMLGMDQKNTKLRVVRKIHTQQN